jgi:four helix bundle protein
VYINNMSTIEESLSNDPLRSDSLSVTVDVLQFCRELPQLEATIRQQLSRSVLSVGSNISESKGSETLKVMRSKLAIAYRECQEARFQLKVISCLEPRHADRIAALDKRLDSIAARLYTAIRSIRSRESDTSTHHSRYK